MDRGYLENQEDRKGRPAKLVVADALPDDIEILPAPERLQGCTVADDLQGVKTNNLSKAAGRESEKEFFSTPSDTPATARGIRPVNALSLFHDLEVRGVILEVQGKFLKVDAPAGVLTEEHRAALKEHKPKLLRFLSRTVEEPQEAPERESVVRWSGPGLIRIRDPFTGEWHEWPAAKCLPGVVADRRRKGGADIERTESGYPGEGGR
jgi:hypothetical protein